MMIRIIFQECHTVYEKECTTETKHKYKEGSSNNLKEIRFKCREDFRSLSLQFYRSANVLTPFKDRIY